MIALEPTVRAITDCPFTFCAAPVSMGDVPSGWTTFECENGHAWWAVVAQPDACDRGLPGGFCGLPTGHDEGCAVVEP